MGCFLKPALKRIGIAIVVDVGRDCCGRLSPTLIRLLRRLRNKLRRNPAIPAPVRVEHEEPVNVTGQETIYDSKTDTFVVKGDAVMTQGGSVLKADEIDIMRRDHKARAIGNVHLIDPEVEMWATEGTIDMTNETMVLYNAKILAKQNIYHLEGKQVIKQEGQTYEVKKGYLHDLRMREGHARSWSINAKQMTVNVGQTGTATQRHLQRRRLPGDSDAVPGFSGRLGSAQRLAERARGSIGAARLSVAAAVLYRDQQELGRDRRGRYRDLAASRRPRRIPAGQRQGRLPVGGWRILQRIDPVAGESRWTMS